MRSKFIENMIMMLDNENTRYVIRQNMHFGKFFAVFTDPKSATNEQNSMEKRAAEFLTALLQSDQGLFFLLNNIKI